MKSKTASKRITRPTRAGLHAYDEVGLRGGIEVMLKNAFTGEVILHGKGPNNVLYIGRNMLMTRAFTTASQTNTIVPVIVIGTGSTATQATHTGPNGYFTFQTGGIAQTTQSGGTGQPIFQMTASWESTALNSTGFNSIWEFLLGFCTTSNSSSFTPYLCRYLSNTFINATTSNQLLITYTVSF